MARWKVLLIIFILVLIGAMVVSEPVRWFVFFIPFMIILFIVNLFDNICGPDGPIVISASPDRRINAFLIESDCGATTPNTTLLYLAPFDDKPKPGNGKLLMKADDANICALYWTSPYDLVMEIAYGRDFIGPHPAIPMGVIFDDEEKTGEVRFHVHKAPVHDRCTLGWPFVPDQAYAQPFLDHSGFPTYQDRMNNEEMEKRENKKQRSQPHEPPAINANGMGPTAP